MILLSAQSTVIITSVVFFLSVIILLVALLLFAKKKLTPSGIVKISINEGDLEVETEPGSTLLSTLGENKILLPSACGGGGTCAMCRCQVENGGGSILPTETGYFTRKEQNDNWRLACQVKVKEDMEIHVEEEVMGVKEWEAKVVSNYNVATYIKEFIVEIPEDMDYKAGGYIQIKIPPCTVNFSDMDIKAHPQDHPGEPDKFEKDWSEGPYAMRHLVMKNDEDTVRAYSMASYPAEGRKIMLNVRYATPPLDRAKGGWMNVHPGIASSYIIHVKIREQAGVKAPEFIYLNELANDVL